MNTNFFNVQEIGNRQYSVVTTPSDFFRKVGEIVFLAYNVDVVFNPQGFLLKVVNERRYNL